FAFGGSFLIYLGTRPSRGSLVKSLVLAAVFATIYHLHHGAHMDYFGSNFGTVMGFLGMGAVQTMVASTNLKGRARRFPGRSERAPGLRKCLRRSYTLQAGRADHHLPARASFKGDTDDLFRPIPVTKTATWNRA